MAILKRDRSTIYGLSDDLSSFSTSIDEETQNRTAADTALGTRIDGEITDRANADAAIQAELDNSQASIGLSTAGSYTPGTLNYAGSASSIVNALELIDAALKTEEQTRITEDGKNALDSSISTVGKTGSYSDLLNKPDLSVLNDVVPYPSMAAFPVTGETGKVYIAEDSGYMYRWSGTAYVQLTDQTAIWGEISGTLSNQTDLQNALDAKLDTANAYTSADFNTDFGLMSTSGLSEGTNLYFTDVRAQSAISVSGDLSYLNGVISFSETYSTPLEVKTAYETNADTNVFTDSEKTKLGAIESGATADQTALEIKTAYESNVNTNAFTDTERTKLGGIETGATADQTKIDIDALNIDADTVDGLHASSFALDSSISVVGKSGRYNDILNRPDLSVLNEVFSYSSKMAFPVSGEPGKIYIAEDTEYVYRWNGTVYILLKTPASWGDISGTLSNQTDLQNALDAKLDSTNAYTSADFNTDFSLKSTSGLSEGTNLYFTGARATSAIKADPSWNSLNWDTAFGWGDHSLVGYELSSNKGVANGYAGLNSSGKVPSAQLPSFVDDVLEYASETNFPITGENGKLYVALDTNKVYRWSGTVYVYITSGAVDTVNGKDGIVVLTSTDISEGTNKYFTDARSRSAISVSGDLSYNQTNGVISFSETYSTPLEIKTAYESNLDTNAFSDSEKTKLGGIEPGATADQTASEIKIAYESNANTNAFSDSEKTKLGGIEPGADITDSTNVQAAGALMDSEVTNLTQVKTFDSSDYATAQQGEAAYSGMSTGIISGGNLSVNATDPTKIDIASGSGYVVDDTVTPATATYVEWASKIAVTLTDLTTAFNTDLAIDSLGNVVQARGYSEKELRSLIFLGGVDHSGGSVNNTFPVGIPSFGFGTSIRDLSDAIGDLNLSGNLYGPNGANLNIDKTSGIVFSYGRNVFQDKNSPHIIKPIALTALAFNYIYSDGSVGTIVEGSRTTIDTQNYDSGSGTLSPVGVNNFSLHNILYFPNSNNTFIQYGDVTFNSMKDAVNGLPTVTFTRLPGFTTAVRRGVIIVRKGATALNNPDDARFFIADKFGSIAGSIGTGTQNDGDMLAEIYDPRNITADVFDRANHTGTQLLSSISDVTATATELNLLDGITVLSGSNTGDQTKADIDALNVDADTVDGLHASSFALDSSISVVGKTGSYSDLLNKPDLSVLNDVVPYASLAGFPVTGETGKVYIAEDSGYMYRWSGTAYVQLTDQTAIWGEISGTLSNQTDLQNALDAKLDTANAYTSADFNTDFGLKSTSDLSEGTNLYFTDTRAQDAISVSGDLSYLNGVISFSETYSTPLEVKTAYESNTNTNVFTDTEKTKLGGIESGATADQTKADIDALNINADTVDGLHAASFLRSDQGTKGDLYYHNGTGFVRLPAGTTGQVIEMGSTGLPAWADKTIG